MVITTDDFCLENMKYFEFWDRVKLKRPSLRLVVFTIANFKNGQDVSKSEEFREWFYGHKDWCKIGVHGYDHLYPPECERDDQREVILRALKILRPFLSEKFLYRPPGFQVTCKTEPVLKELGFAGIAYQNRIKYFDGGFDKPFNTHCCDRYFNPITKIWKRLAS